MSRLIHASHEPGYHDLVTADSDYAKFLRFATLTLGAGESYTGATTDAEAVAVILTGTATATVEGHHWAGLGGRATVFDGNPTSVYIPIETAYTFLAETDVEIAIAFATTTAKHEPFLITPDEVSNGERGEQLWKRSIRDILTISGEGRVGAIVIGETINHRGHWSSYPPHKHDGESGPDEPNFEEIYHYRVDPAEGYGVQLHYTDDRSIDDAHIVRDKDTFVIERGYHPISAPGGHAVYYLWVMAGDTGRALNPFIEPAFRRYL